MSNGNPIFTVSATRGENIKLGLVCGTAGAAFGGFLYSLVKSVTIDTVKTVNKMLENYIITPKSNG